MANSLYYHGTTEEGLKAILNNTGKIAGPWECSNYDDMMYFFSLNKKMELGGYIDDADIHDATLECISDCFNQAKFQLATLEFKDTKLFVLEYELDGDLMQDDKSCDGMEYSAAVCTNTGNIDNSNIKRIWCAHIAKTEIIYTIIELMQRDLFSHESSDRDLYNFCFEQKDNISIPEQYWECPDYFEYEKEFLFPKYIKVLENA